MDFLIQLDQLVFHLINSQWTHPWADWFFVFITDLHKTFFIKFIVAPGVLIYLVYRRKLTGLLQFLFLALTMGIADGVIGRIIKNSVMRTRPSEAGIDAIVRSGYGGHSFTSNHASNIFCLAFILSALFPKGRTFFFIYAFLVAYSRPYVGVHYPSDVIAGALWGSAWALLCIHFILKPLTKKFHRG